MYSWRLGSTAKQKPDQKGNRDTNYHVYRKLQGIDSKRSPLFLPQKVTEADTTKIKTFPSRTRIRAGVFLFPNCSLAYALDLLRRRVCGLRFAVCGHGRALQWASPSFVFLRLVVVVRSRWWKPQITRLPAAAAAATYDYRHQLTRSAAANDTTAEEVHKCLIIGCTDLTRTMDGKQTARIPLPDEEIRAELFWRFVSGSYRTIVQASRETWCHFFGTGKLTFRRESKQE